MDEKFLEFWGNLLINAAQGKKQTDTMFQWMQSGFPDFNNLSSIHNVPDFKELSKIFQKLYGLDQFSHHSEDYKKMSDKALQDFKKSFKDYLDLMGIVTKQEHLSLIKKYENLKAKCKDQEETIKHLQLLLDAKETGQAAMSGQFHDIVKNQGELFQKMMKDFGQYFNASEEKNKNSERGEQDNDKPGRSRPDD